MRNQMFVTFTITTTLAKRGGFSASIENIGDISIQNFKEDLNNDSLLMNNN